MSGISTRKRTGGRSLRLAPSGKNGWLATESGDSPRLVKVMVTSEGGEPLASNDREGVEALSRELYDQLFPVVYGYFLRRLSGDREVAADLTQDTFVAFARSLGGPVRIESPGPWVVVVARRRLIDHLRRQSRRLRVTAEPGREPSTGEIWSDAREGRLATALASISGMHRAVLVLRFVDGLTVREVAETIGRSQRATESLIVRARRSLRSAWEETADV